MTRRLPRCRRFSSLDRGRKRDYGSLMKKHLKRIRAVVFHAKWKLVCTVLVFGALLGFCDWFVGHTTSTKVTDSIASLRHAPVALVLGTSRTSHHRSNPFYEARIAAAVQLYESGIVSGVLVSGDNRRSEYNEPQMMKEDLMASGVPAKFITLDYAGFRTLDSVVRAKKVFQQQNIIIVSQRFHAQRALFVARRHGISAQAYAAAEPPFRWHLRVRTREVFARLLACLDGMVNRQPHFLGPLESVALKETA